MLTGNVSRNASESSFREGAQRASSAAAPAAAVTTSASMQLFSASNNISAAAASTTTGSSGSSGMRHKATKDALAQELLIILQMLIEASNHFSKDDCFQHAARCMALSDFFTVVLGRVIEYAAGRPQDASDSDVDPAEMLIGLYSRAQATESLGSFANCADAVAMAQACDLHLSWQTWTSALYEQVVKKHNLSFLKDLHASDDTLLAPAAFDRLTELFKADPERTRHADAFKAALEFWLYNVTSSLHEVQTMMKSVAGDEELTAMGIQAVGDDFLSALRNDN